jgi:phosphopantothenoylcysteine decarboxylase/phosphopantothenate--cysteine ligase
LGLAAVKRVLLIITGGIAAYKALELIRLLKKSDYAVTCVLTEAGAQFVTPLSVQALSGTRVYTDLWSLTDESEMGHIELSRSADLVVVAPATANILAAMAAGLCGDHAAAGDRQAGAGRPCDECAHVGACGDAGEPCHAQKPRRRDGTAG